MNLVGELVIGRARIERLVQEASLRDFDEPLSQLGRISGDIQELVTKLRMVPVSFIFERFPRLVRDLSKTLGKEIELQMEGQETELDRTVIDEIGDPMVHIIRNCVDHGIETIEDRKKAGKPEKGLVKISAYQEGSGVIIEVTDDGKGIDSGKVRKKALANGVITEEESAAMSDEEVINLIFLPGFSMAEKVTDVSGRGVGMDAVKTKVESLGGQFDVSSEVGVGTRVFVRLPLTLAIVLALLIKVGEETYAIPLENVEETILVKKENVRTVHGAPATLLRGEVLTLCSLAGSLGMSSVAEEENDEFPVVVVKTGRMRVGFIVDDLIGQQDIVIKSLGRFLSKIRGIAGATILGDGNVALILDVAGLYGR
jgi:two-component system chemotaxis sensor kinase CheA